ncbi:MAG: tetratricopeptide repeat protein [Actinomycetota bacterium]|nr:tetratricopeptide repeat protein [Actinomycetota bacterium]
MGQSPVADVTDATFEQAVLARSEEVPVVVDLWAPWCGPCKTLGPVLEKVVAEADGKVELAKVNVDENPRVGTTFRVQSIPAVFALRDRQIVDQFIGAVPEAQVRAFVERLLPQPSPADKLVALGTEDALRAALDLQPDHPGAVVALAELLVWRGDAEEALALLARVPETAETRRVAALARMGGTGGLPDPDGVEAKLDALLERVRDDDAARQELLDLLEVLGPDDPRTNRYRRAMTSRLF